MPEYETACFDEHSRFSGVKHSRPYIAFEGMNGSGKSEQMKLLCEALETAGWGIVQTGETYEMSIQGVIRSMTTQKSRENDPLAVALLHTADRILHTKEVILPGLQEGKAVVSDRSVYATLAYQSQYPETPLEMLLGLNSFAVIPDVAFFLLLEPELAESRRANRDSLPRIYENLDFQKALRKRYQLLAERFKERKEHSIHVIDASASIPEVHAQIMNAMEDFLK